MENIHTISNMDPSTNIEYTTVSHTKINRDSATVPITDTLDLESREVLTS